MKNLLNDFGSVENVMLTFGLLPNGIGVFTFTTFTFIAKQNYEHCSISLINSLLK